MKKFLTLALFMWIPVFAAPLISEVSVEQAFIPQKGYDSNDNVELVLDGKLPNACFELSRSKIDINQNKFIINIKQFIKVKDIKECHPNHQGHQDIPLWPVQYTNLISLGNLRPGKYTLKFQNGSELKTKSFEITPAVSAGMDNYLYAPISDAFIPELVYSTDDAQVILTGVLTNTCMIFNGRVEVQRINNVFILLPKMDLNSLTDCMPTQIPLQRIVSLGKIKKEGRYLIHIRSTTGRSVNKIFTVINDPLNHTGR